MPNLKAIKFSIGAFFLFLIIGAATNAVGKEGVDKLLAQAEAHFGAEALAAKTLRTLAAVDSPNGGYTIEVRTNEAGAIFFQQKKADGGMIVGMHAGVLSTLGRKHRSCERRRRGFCLRPRLSLERHSCAHGV